ncbi:WhiB family redox-sensing transcriptional regulator [Zhihengliuella halotolerans]|uniref:WhiB family redox-sensing transcriptional regulator n=2 Tax=Zhihengliuella halotolerans TaxID=370736 RepID=A0A4Q8AC52_9MICC|nr:WhiB family redox-sensing transcriptional regulator [Zhihengliuella halotolerans]
MLEVPEMLRDAACAGMDPDLADEMFFPGSNWDPNRYDMARRRCESCPVREACLEHALAGERGAASNRAGMFGGKTPEERANIHRRRRAAERKAS